MIKYFLCTILATCITCTAFNNFKLQQDPNITDDSWLTINQTCNEDPQTIQALLNTMKRLDAVQDEVTTLNHLIIGMMFVALFELFAYAPLLYTTYKQILAAEKRINQIAPAR